MEYAFAHPVEVATMVERGQKIYRAHAWRGERPHLINIVDQLLSR